jgi:pimeloyl-ACP methyl ester carboxylesterase
MVDELHTLLSTAQVPGPYVLVGHSFGGFLVRLYAARYPQEVAGLVLVDSAHEDQYRRAPCEIRELVPQFAEQTRQQLQGLNALIASGSLDPAVLPVPPQLPGPAADTFRALVAASPKHVDTFIAEQGAVEAIHAELAGLSSRGRLVVADDSGHYIQLERPQLVVDAIAEVVAAARTGSGDPAARASAEKEELR